MDPTGYYERRLREQREALSALQARSGRLSLGRVATFVVGASSVGAHLFSRTPGALPLGLALLAAFAALVVWHARVAQEEERRRAAVLFCERGLLRASGAGEQLPARGGKRPDHPYAADLDLLGERSVMARLDAMETELSEQRLERWLLEPAGPGLVRARQQAVRELGGRPELLEDLFVHARPAATKHPDLPAFLAWCSGPAQAQGAMLAVAVALPIATAVLFFAGPALGAPDWAWGAGAALQWALTFGLGGRRAAVGLDGASRGAAALGAFGEVIERLGREKLAAPALAEVAGTLAPAGAALRRLETLASWAEARENGMFRLMVGPLVMYDLHLWLALERWHAEHGTRVGAWVDALAETLALAGLGTFAFDNPDATFPELTEGPPRIAAEGLVHPLLGPSSRVANDVELPGPGSALLITGSNMSGKSTLLRALGVAAVMAQAGAPVAARKLTMTPLAVRTSIRISDSLASGYSHFYAELLALKRVVDDAAHGPVLFLLDEILHGTNSRERQAGAKAVVAHLLRQGALGAVTTHDLGLADLVGELPDQVRPVHLLEQQDGDRMTFDYKLRDGLLHSGNALALMRQLGLPV